MYTFTDKGNRELTLRPEGTPGVVRAFLQNKLKPPQRLFYIGPMFRYERPQKGRYREFFQLGAEVFGEAQPETDVELIEMAMRFFNEINLNDIIIKINSVGCAVCRPPFRTQLKLFLDKELDKICPDCKVRAEQNPLRVFDCKTESCQKIYEVAPKITDHLCYDCEQHFQVVLKELNHRQLPFELNKMMVRGLDYYTRTTFEFVPSQEEELGSQDSVGGGGRYDNLIEDFGGAKTPAVGFALGLDRILICLGNNIKIQKPIYIIALDQSVENHAKQLLTILRNANIPALLNQRDKNLRAALGVANNLGCHYVIIIGDNEIENKVYTLKNLVDRTQQQIAQDKTVEELKRLII